MVSFKAQVVPGSSRDQFVGWLGDALKTKVVTPPEKDKASEAVSALVAERLGVAPSAVKIVTGHSTATKELAIAGLDNDTLKQAIP